LKIRNAAAAVLALLVVLGAILAGTALSGDGSEDAVRSTPGCSDRGWAATAVGKPAALSAGSRSFYVWRDRKSWHVQARASSSAPLMAKVQANARLRVLRSTGVRPTLSAGSRRLTVRFASSRLSGVAFRAACATRLNFKLDAVQPSPVAPAGGASPIPGSQGSTPRVFLGASGQAPGNAFRLQRPATTGAAGRILVSSPCRGPSACPPPKPVEGTVRIETAPAQKGRPSEVVARVRSDEGGNFSAQFAPGRYQLIVEKAAGYPVAKARIAEVEAGVVTQVDLYLDSGIR
jgi:hypothetical protein